MISVAIITLIFGSVAAIVAEEGDMVRAGDPLLRVDNDEYRMQEIFGFKQAGISETGRAQGSFYATGNVPSFSGRLEELGIELPAGLFEKRIIGIAKTNGSSSREVLS